MPTLLALVVLGGLYLSKWHNYLLFHSLVELFSIVVACSIFIIAWNTRHFGRSSYLTFVGIGYLFVGAVDLVHTLAYTGMGVFVEANTNLPTQMWIIARYLEAMALLLAPVALIARVRPTLVLSGFAAVTALALVVVFVGIFPACFVEGTGLTPFKVASEFVIAGLLVGAAALLWHHRGEFDRPVALMLMASIGITAIAEIAFTLYRSPYGPANMIGHYLKLVSFYLIYRALVQTGLRQPYALLFRNLKQSEDALRRARDELEERVQQRTSALQESRDQLRTLAGRILTAQEDERRRLAREMHDDLSQRLAVLAIGAGSLEQELAQSADPNAEKLGQMHASLVKLSEDVHGISRQLHPSILDDLGLADALKSECQAFTEREGIRVAYGAMNVPLGLPRDVAVCLYRIAQESLRNVAAHAGVTEVSVSLVGTEVDVALTVKDAGVGFDRSRHGQPGLGLASMQERVHLVQGHLSVQSAPGRGTVIKVRVPL